MSDSEASVLIVEKAERIATLTLNRPRAMNALSRELRTALVRALAELRADAGVDAVILTGAGEKAFCAGLDLKELGGETAAPAGAGGALGAVGSGADVIAALESFDRPVIGAINGYAITGGFELALACDLLVASENARFADTHARVGILPGWGLSQKLSRLVGIHRAKELSLTGNFLDARAAADWGLVNRVVAPEQLLPTCRALARDMQGCLPEILRAYKSVIDRGFAATFADGLRIERDTNREHAKSLTPADVAARRRGVQERGRAQSH
jgi:enoyl-CoA hydratase